MKLDKHISCYTYASDLLLTPGLGVRSSLASQPEASIQDGFCERQMEYAKFLRNEP
jgi:hypothetical protein